MSHDRIGFPFRVSHRREGVSLVGPSYVGGRVDSIELGKKASEGGGWKKEANGVFLKPGWIRSIEASELDLDRDQSKVNTSLGDVKRR